MSNLNTFLEHYGVKGMKWGVTKEEYKSLSRSDRKQYRPKTLGERAETYKKAREQNLNAVYNAAKSQGDNVFIKTRIAGDAYEKVMLGKEFVAFIEAKGAIDANMTQVWGWARTKEAADIQDKITEEINKIWAPTAERYVRKEPKK